MTKVTIVKNYLTDKVPRVCFASVMENRNRQKVRKAYTGLVLLEVNNLTSPTSKYSLILTVVRTTLKREKSLFNDWHRSNPVPFL